MVDGPADGSALGNIVGMIVGNQVGERLGTVVGKRVGAGYVLFKMVKLLLCPLMLFKISATRIVKWRPGVFNPAVGTVPTNRPAVPPS